MQHHHSDPDVPKVSRSTRLRRSIATLIATVMIAPALASVVPDTGLAAQTPGMGFTVSPADIDYILDQIIISEKHSAAKACFDNATVTAPCTNAALIAIDPLLTGLVYDQANDPNLCAALRKLVVNPMLSFGLRLTDGSCNNLQPGQEKYGAADQPFPRVTTPVFSPAEDSLPAFGPPHSTSYAQTSGSVFDSEPRTISNIIVDQTTNNPAAVCASQFPVRAQGLGASCPQNAGANLPPNVPVQIDNITTDVGLSPPFNSLFTIFGQFFDHGLDKVTNGGNGAVIVPLKADDPLVAGPDHLFGPDGCTTPPATCDDLAPELRFMVLTRGSVGATPDANRSAPNTDTPFVDQSQTYTSHSSHQLFLREYVNNASGKPVSTGKFLGTADGAMATWKQVKAQAATMLGLELTDANVGNIPMIAMDGYGNFIPGPSGLPQYVTQPVRPNGPIVFVEGNRAIPVPVPADAIFINTAFLNDIAHSAGPTNSNGSLKTPDANLVAGGSLDLTAPGEYDNELLDLHFICGDGRCNENIALSAIHQVFHDEHDRLIDDIKNTIFTDGTGILNPADWMTATGAPSPAGAWNGERLFQAARFVTEMEYQHLVFEEFARKVQPLINPFEPFAFNQTDVNPAITAEFAHAVYRFGHSMLDDNIPRLNEDANGNLTPNDIPLLDGFLNPAAYFDGGPVAGTLTAPEAAGSIIMGLSDQTGQEIDEFVVDTLRNHLLGLPLDLPALNMARARSEGIPPLNELRRQIHAATNDGQMTPYTDWVDFGQNLKHPESLVNFIAAYGTHPLIMTLDPDGAGPIAVGSTEARRAAADQIVNGTVLPLAVDPNPPADAAEFMFSITGSTSGTDWSVTETGLNRIDLWVGGLAERTNLFGGLLGSTFNYIFENQLTNLQNGDRFYYLARTPGMNLRAQLEGNSFAELIMRNTTAHSLKADPFANADCKFELRNLQSPATPTTVNPGNTYFQGVGSISDDPASLCNENGVLIQMGDGTIRYRLSNPVNVPGINFQSVYNGRAGSTGDRMYGGNDNDTFWGGDGNDNIEGGDGADIALGGNGNDVITDLAGDDVPKGGPGNDAIDAGPGLDIIMGGDGNDFTNGGANINETFGGAGDDFAIAGAGTDAVLGDSGDDWVEGGDQPDLLIGDSSTLFFDDHNLPGHDILMGQGGDDDYDGEGGDDIYVAGPGVEKNAGASGYDWSTGVGDPQPQNADLTLKILVGAPAVIETRDKFNEVEALSGWNLNDTLRGDDIVPSAIGGGGFIGCDALDAAGVARIGGLVQIVPDALLTEDPAVIAAASATRFCLLTGPAWGAGNILLGGTGNDTIEGRGANDIIDGDRWLNVRLSVRTNPGDPDTQIGSTDLMEHKADVGGTFGPGTANMTLMQAVFARKVDISSIVAVREIVDPNIVTPGDCDAAVPVNCDTALFSGDALEYTITFNGDGSVTVDHNGGLGVDGIDTLRNIEQLSFCIVPGVLRGTCDARDVVPLIPPAPAPVADLFVPLGAESFVAASGAQTAPETIVLTNLGNAALDITGPLDLGSVVPDSAAFHIAPVGTTCADGVSLLPNEFCTVSVFFQTTDPGTLTTNLTIPTNAGDSIATLLGHITAPIASITPLALTGFSAQAGTTSLEQGVVVTNIGDADLTVTSASIVGTDFTVTSNTCLVPVAAGLSCTIGVSMTPGSGGVKAATLVVAHDGLGDTTVTLDGLATQGVATVAPLDLTFTGQVGVAGVAQSMTVTNSGDAVLTVAGAELLGPDAGQFTITGNNCLTLNVAQLCTIGVQFTPTSAGVKTASLVVTHDGVGGTTTVPITATATAPVITVTPGSLTFASTMVTVQTATQTVTVGNTGDANLTVGAVTLGGTNPADFRIVTNGCTTVIPAGNCTIGVAFRPNATGARTATLNIPNNAGAVRTVTLTGTGIAAAPIMTVQASLTFANTRINNTRTATLRITNNGPGNLVLGTLVSSSTRFTANRGNCPNSLGVGRSCSLNVTFRPLTRTTVSGVLTINSNAQFAPHRVTLTGTGI